MKEQFITLIEVRGSCYLMVAVNARYIRKMEPHSARSDMSLIELSDGSIMDVDHEYRELVDGWDANITILPSVHEKIGKITNKPF